ncbi:MAG: dGTP triphosphohydrolase, partial [Bacillota bacterium]
EWKELSGETNSYINALKDKSNDPQYIERRRNAAYTKIENFIRLYKDYNNPYLHSFFSDFSRISFSSAFRRLQDKAQVFPLEKYDYARTRLTHTIEVTGIAMQLANLYGQKLFYNNNRVKKEFAFLFEKCLNCAALLHDLGNPPYGHFGEDTIKEYFQSFWDHKNVILYQDTGINPCKISELNIGSLTEIELEQMKSDFTSFDGNAQSLRVASKTQQYKIGSSSLSSLDLTAAVLGSIIKYPCSSTDGANHQKFGYFYSERDTIQKLTCMGVYNDHLRNPLSMLLEASDDISYVTSDLDDAIKKKALTHEAFLSELGKFEKQAGLTQSSCGFCENFRKFYDYNVSIGATSAFEYTIQRMTNDLRIKLIEEVVSVFYNQAEAILKKGIYYLCKKDAGCAVPPQGTWLLGKYNELLDCVPSAQLISWIKKSLFQKHIYKDINILQNELAGHHVICFLLEQFTDAMLCLDFNKDEQTGGFLLSNPKRQRKKYFRQEKIFELISKNFVDVFKNETQSIDVNSFLHVYYRLRLVADYVSGMTDCYALDICNILKGM